MLTKIVNTAYVVLLYLIVATAVPALSDTLAGNYLAARQADLAHDFKTSEKYYARALRQDPNSPALMENLIVAQISLGRFDAAQPLAKVLDTKGFATQMVNMTMIASAARDGDYAGIIKRIGQEHGIGALIDSLLGAWAITGQGKMSKALAAFDTVATKSGVEAFAGYHKALALASVGDFESASAIFSTTVGGGVRLTRRGIIAQLQTLSQMDLNGEALMELKRNFGNALDPEIGELQRRLLAGETLEFTIVRSPLEGMAEVFYSIANILSADADADYTLLYTRVAEYLRPDHLDAILFSAELLEEIEQYDLASQNYAKIPHDAPSFHTAEMGRADTLRRSGNLEAAIAVLETLARTHGDFPSVHSALGDTQRRGELFAPAVAAYDRAVELYGGPEKAPWFLLYARGICHERLDQWPASEADLRAALRLNPDQPQVLNYLGYSLVEKKAKLQEALKLIERAVALRPESGHIVDSLGWVLFRLRKYTEAVPHLERAAALMPIDPIVNDHLGDAYWSVGRRLEAAFQWHRALSFDPEKKDIARIRRKLEVGLDQVLTEEGAPPLELVRENGG